MRSLGGVGGKVLAVVFTVGVAAACQSDDGGRTAEFADPNAGELTVGYEESCAADNSTSQDGLLSLGAEGFTPGTTVSLEWDVDTRGLNGSWDGVKAGEDGSFRASVELPRAVIDPGDQVEIWAEGGSEEGILAVSKVVPIGDC